MKQEKKRRENKNKIKKWFSCEHNTSWATWIISAGCKVAIMTVHQSIPLKNDGSISWTICSVVSQFTKAYISDLN